MNFGVAIFPVDDGLPPGELAQLIEQRGHESLFFAEHTHIPVSASPKAEDGGPLPRRYWHTYDLFVSMTASVAATTRLRVGSGICLVVERDPIITAKEVASIDYLSGGRVEFGVGAGWNRREMADHGTDPSTRMALMAERVQAMKAIWEQDVASFHGRYVSFDGIWSWPKPAQRPHPPVLVGGYGPGVLDRVLAFGDGWTPGYGAPDLLDRAKELWARADRRVEVQVMGVPADPKVFDELERAGVSRVVHWLPPVRRGPLERALDRYETALAAFHGE